MIILINDANVLIDLVKLDLVSEFASLPYELYTTDFVLNEINEEQLNNFILSFLRKQSHDEVISKIVNFQTLENILGSALIEFDENNNTSFEGYVELEQYHSVATRAYQLGNSVMFEKIIDSSKL